jgi:hypothetical protein
LGIDVAFKQSLTSIQCVRNTIFENSYNEVFTGSGWCGYKPPYISVDDGETWSTANQGSVYPPNSTFSYSEFNEDTYVGTGYAPYKGQLYKWLGRNWALVYEFPLPRTIVNTQEVFDGSLFIGASNYGYSYNGDPAVVVTTDGVNFSATEGLHEDINPVKLINVSGKLMLVAKDLSADIYAIYTWRGSSWANRTIIPFTSFSQNCVVVHEDEVYLYGTHEDYTYKALFKSEDNGKNWQMLYQITPEAFVLYVYENTLFIGTYADDSDHAHIHRLVL